MNLSKPLIVAAALLTSSAAFSAMIPEGSYPETPVVSQAVQRDNVRAAAVADEGARPWQADGRPAFRSYAGPQASRAQVVSERNDWQASGQSALSQAAEPVFATPAYQRGLDRVSQGAGSAE